jgi:host factor-I protein
MFRVAGGHTPAQMFLKRGLHRSPPWPLITGLAQPPRIGGPEKAVGWEVARLNPSNGNAVSVDLLAQPALRRLRRNSRKDPRGTSPRYKNGTTAMAADRSQNLQDTFLNYVRKNKIPLTIFLVNGVKLQGVVTWFDNFCVLLRRDGHSQLVYKHAISTIMPGHPVQLFEGAEDAPAGEKV